MKTTIALTLLIVASTTATPAQYYQANPCQLNEELYFVPHPNECNKYYMCNFQHAGLFTCPANLQFNPDLNVCDYPNVVGCINTPYPTEATTTMAPENSTSADSITTTVTTVKPENVTTGNFSVKSLASDYPCQLHEELYFVPHPEECSKYYMCHYHHAALFTCPANLQFNPDLNVCDYPDVVGCIDDQHPTGPTEATPTVDGDKTTTEMTPTTTKKQDDQTTETSFVQCHYSEDGYAVILPNPADCSTFFICVGLTPVGKQCKPGLLFNPELLVCDYPNNVTCA